MFEALNYSLADLLLAVIGGMALGTVIQGVWEASAPEEKCAWVKRDGYYYITDCDRIHILEDGVPQESAMTLCPYCGRVLEMRERHNDRHYHKR